MMRKEPSTSAALVLGTVLGASIPFLSRLEYWPDIPYSPILLLICALMAVQGAKSGALVSDRRTLLPLVSAAITSASLTTLSLYSSPAATALSSSFFALCWRYISRYLQDHTISGCELLATASLAVASLSIIADGFGYAVVITVLITLALLLESLNRAGLMEMLRPCLLGGVAGAVIFREMNGHIEMLGADTVFHVMVAVAFLVTLDRTTTVTDSDE